jgi:putative phosphoribosyl transferase
MTVRFKDRQEAGRQLAARLTAKDIPSGSYVLALPRGGVPVAFEIARALKLPLDVWLVRKLGVPGQEELAMGAVSSSGTIFLNDAVLSQLNLSQADIDSVIRRERQELARRERRYREGLSPLAVENRTVILVDDGVATGASLLAARQALSAMKPARLIAALPVAPEDTRQHLKSYFDEVICLATPEPFIAVGRWYEAFPQVHDDEVCDLLERARIN